MSNEFYAILELYETRLQETDENGNPYGHGKVYEKNICHIPVENGDRLLDLVEWAASHKLQFRIHDPELGCMEVEWQTH